MKFCGCWVVFSSSLFSFAFFGSSFSVEVIDVVVVVIVVFVSLGNSLLAEIVISSFLLVSKIVLFSSFLSSFFSGSSFFSSFGSSILFSFLLSFLWPLPFSFLGSFFSSFFSSFLGSFFSSFFSSLISSFKSSLTLSSTFSFVLLDLSDWIPRLFLGFLEPGFVFNLLFFSVDSTSVFVSVVSILASLPLSSTTSVFVVSSFSTDIYSISPWSTSCSLVW